jgi:hypothetical protein
MDRKHRIPYLILSVLLLAAAAGGYAYREFHRTKPAGAQLKAERTMTAAALIAAFAKDEPTATAAHAGHVLAVEGLLKETDRTDSARPVIVLTDGSTTTSLRFLLDSTFRADLEGLVPGTPLRMKGVCTGFQPDDMGLGADILFDRSVILTPQTAK